MIARIRYLQSGNVEYYINGQLVTRDEYDAAVPSKLEGLFDGGEAPYANPLWAGGSWESDALRVHPDQRQEATEWSRNVGVPTSYREDGSPEILDRDHRRRLLRASGMHNNRGGYSD